MSKCLLLHATMLLFIYDLYQCARAVQPLSVNRRVVYVFLYKIYQISRLLQNRVLYRSEWYTKQIGGRTDRDTELKSIFPKLLSRFL